MADNVNYTNPGTGSIIATDEVTINSVLAHLQRIKISLGIDGAYQADLAYGNAPSASSVPVTLASDQITRFGASAVAATNTLGSSQVTGQMIEFCYSYNINTNVWQRNPCGSSTPPDNTVAPYVRNIEPANNKFSNGQKQTYLSCSNGLLTPSMGTSVYDTSLAYLATDTSNNKKGILQKILVSWSAGGSGKFILAVAKGNISSIDGTVQLTIQEDTDDDVPACSFVTGYTTVPTRVGDAIYLTFPADVANQVELLDILEGKGLVLKPNTDECWEIHVMTTDTSISPVPLFTANVTWTEE